MEDFNSKYTGQQVEDLLDQVASGNVGGSGGITVETDPIFSASPAATITEQKIAEWDAKSEQGEKGDKGDKGDTGVGIASVKQTTTSTADGGTNVVTVTLSNGTTSTFNVKNGSKGSNGTNGTNGKDGADGEDGATFTPSVDSEGNLSWSNDKGLDNPPTVNIKGPKGDAGSGGEGSSSSSAKEFVVIEPDYEPRGYTGSFSRSNPLEPNKVYVFSQPIVSLQVNDINESESIGDEYTIMFTAAESTIITLPDYQVYWANGTIPTISNGDMCELSLVRIGSVLKAVLSIFKAV